MTSWRQNKPAIWVPWYQKQNVFAAKVAIVAVAVIIAATRPLISGSSKCLKRHSQNANEQQQQQQQQQQRSRASFETALLLNFV